MSPARQTKTRLWLWGSPRSRAFAEMTKEWSIRALRLNQRRLHRIQHVKQQPQLRDPRRVSPGVLLVVSARFENRAQGMPGAQWHPQPRLLKVVVECTRVVGFTVIGENNVRRLDTSVEVPGPHDFTVRRNRRSSSVPVTTHGEQSALERHRMPDAAASTASCPVFVRIAKRPFQWDRTARDIRVSLANRKRKFFCKRWRPRDRFKKGAPTTDALHHIGLCRGEPRGRRPSVNALLYR